MVVKRLDSLLLAGVGVLIVHQIAYTSSAVFGLENSVAHGHMAVAWFGGSLALLGALALSVSRSLKRRSHDAGSVSSLATAISLGYIAMEQIERLVDGYSLFALFSEPVFWLGLALAPLVAMVLHWSVQSAAVFAALLLTPPSPHRWSTVQVQPVHLALVVSPIPTLLSSVVSRRGPPRS